MDSRRKRNKLKAMIGFGSGEIIIILVALGFLVLMPVLIAAIVFFGVRRAKRNRSVWSQLAAKLNMTVEQSFGLGLSGTFKGRPLSVAVGKRGGHDSQEIFTYCVAEFRNGLRFLLNIESRKLFSSLIGSSNTIKLGNATFDDRFLATCYDPKILANFLFRDFPSAETGNLLGDLILAGETGLTVEIDDSRVYIESRGDTADENRILQIMNTAVRLADRFEAARKSFPLVEWELQAFKNWNRTAAELGLQFDRDAFRTSGNHRGFPVEFFVTSAKQNWQTTFRVKFPANLMIGLQIFPENSIHRAMNWIGAQDVRIGIEDFDDTFVVKSKNEGGARAKLQADVCRQLTELRKISGDLKIDDESITVVFNEAVADANKLRSYIQAVVASAAMICR